MTAATKILTILSALAATMSSQALPRGRFVPNISCKSKRASIVVNLSKCRIIPGDRAQTCAASIKVGGQTVDNIDSLMMLKAVLPQTQNESLMLTTREQANGKMVFFSGMISSSSQNADGRLHLEANNQVIDEQMTCNDNSNPSASQTGHL